MLNSREKQILQTIEHFHKEHGKNPSYRQIMQILGFKSTGSLYRYITALRKKGFLQIGQEGRGVCSLTDGQPCIKKTVEIEIIGTVSKTNPPQLLKNPTKIDISHDFFHKDGTIYGLHIKDESFLEEQMLPGDILLIQADPEPSFGSYVLASDTHSIIGLFYEEESAMLFFKGNFSSSPDKQPIATIPSETQIWGHIVGILRQYGKPLISNFQ